MQPCDHVTHTSSAASQMLLLLMMMMMMMTQIRTHAPALHTEELTTSTTCMTTCAVSGKQTDAHAHAQSDRRKGRMNYGQEMDLISGLVTAMHRQIGT